MQNIEGFKNKSKYRPFCSDSLWFLYIMFSAVDVTVSREEPLIHMGQNTPRLKNFYPAVDEQLSQETPLFCMNITKGGLLHFI